jgi:hypothetical protein
LHEIESRRNRGRRTRRTRAGYLRFSTGFETCALENDINTDIVYYKRLAKKGSFIAWVPRDRITPCLQGRSMSAELGLHEQQSGVRMPRFPMKIRCGMAWKRPNECC